MSSPSPDDRFGRPGIPLTPNQRQARYQARRRSEPDVPYGQPGRPRGARDTPTDILRALGLDLGPEQQSVDLVAARQSRESVAREDARRSILSLASAVIKSRRAANLIFAEWKTAPSASNLQRVDEANRARSFAEDQLREAVLQDQALFAAAIRAAGG